MMTEPQERIGLVRVVRSRGWLHAPDEFWADRKDRLTMVPIMKR